MDPNDFSSAQFSTQFSTSARSSNQSSTRRVLKLARGQRRQRGAAVFVVMMAIIVLTGVGVWSVHLAGLTDAASGYHRAAAQTLYLAEMGTVAGSAYLSLQGQAASNYAVGKNNPDDCISVSNAPSLPPEFCKVIWMQDIEAEVDEQTQAVAGGPFTVLDLTAGGSLGARNTTEGEFVLELSEPRKVELEGMGIDSAIYQEVSLTTYGLTRPPTGVVGMCSGASTGPNGMSTRLGMRARMIIGPISAGTTTTQ